MLVSGAIPDAEVRGLGLNVPIVRPGGVDKRGSPNPYANSRRDDYRAWLGLGRRRPDFRAGPVKARCAPLRRAAGAFRRSLTRWLPGWRPSYDSKMGGHTVLSLSLLAT